MRCLGKGLGFVAAVLTMTALVGTPAPALAASSACKSIAGVPSPNPREGVQPNVIDRGLALAPIAHGTDPLENPSGVITHFGLLSDGTKTEPDENTYLVLNKNPG